MIDVTEIMPHREPIYERLDPDVLEDYDVGKRIGRGCYGIVWMARDKDKTPKPLYPDENEIVEERKMDLVVKKIMHAFRNAADAQRTYREVLYMEAFSSHDNICTLKRVVTSADDRHLYLILDMWDSDLQKAMRCQTLQEVHKPFVAYQVLRALKYMHSAGVMHRDVKPANILIDSACCVALTDFGCARRVPASNDENHLMTDYISSRWYRAPEMLLGGRHYSDSVDIWALGCVVAEMHSHEPILPGTSTLDMIERCIALLGKPFPGDIVAMEARYSNHFFDPLPAAPAYRPIKMIFNVNLELADFLELTMQWSPVKRFTAPEALEHPYLSPARDPDSEPIFGRQLVLTVKDTKTDEASRYRDQIYSDILMIEKSKRKVLKQRLRDLEAEDEEEEFIYDEED